MLMVSKLNQTQVIIFITLIHAYSKICMKLHFLYLHPSYPIYYTSLILFTDNRFFYNNNNNRILFQIVLAHIPMKIYISSDKLIN